MCRFPMEGQSQTVGGGNSGVPAVCVKFGRRPVGGASRQSRPGFAQAVVDGVSVDGLKIVVRIREVSVDSSTDFLRVGSLHSVSPAPLIGYSSDTASLSSRNQEFLGLLGRRPRYLCYASLGIAFTLVAFLS